MTAPADIADLIDRLKGYFALSAIGVALTVHSDAEELMRQVGISVDDSIRLSRTKGYGDYELPLTSYARGSETTHQQRNAMLQSWLELTILHVGHKLAVYNYFDKAPVLVFFRHIRNGVAHGNRMNVRPDRDKKGREKEWKEVKWGNFEIKPYMEAAAVGGLLRRGDALALLDDVAVYLRTLQWKDGVDSSDGRWVSVP